MAQEERREERGVGRDGQLVPLDGDDESGAALGSRPGERTGGRTGGR